jgi:hypothetical protein
VDFSKKALDGTAELFLRFVFEKKTKERIKWHMVEDMVGQEGMGQEEILDHARCTKRSAQAARQSAKFLSSRPRVDLFTAGTALQNNHADFKHP